MTPPRVIDITRPVEVVAVCPECGWVLHLPENWQEVMRPTAGPEWDGQVRCRAGHPLAKMVIVGTKNRIDYDRDGCVVIHLVTDDRLHKVCTGERWGPPQNLPPETRMTLCEACRRWTMK